MDAYHLSHRLQTVAGFVLSGSRLAEIGSDHAYLPAYLAMNKKIKWAIAGEVVTGPYQNAVHEIRQLHLENLVATRQADGLAAIHVDEEIDVVTICGMGGSLICQILTAGFDQLNKRPRLILQPNVNEVAVRHWLIRNSYQIVAEEIVAEDRHIYEIIVADPIKEPITLTTIEYLFGPLLLQAKSPAFIQKWQGEKLKLQRVLAQLTQAQNEPVAKEQELQQKIKLIEEILND